MGTRAGCDKDYEGPASSVFRRIGEIQGYNDFDDQLFQYSLIKLYYINILSFWTGQLLLHLNKYLTHHVSMTHYRQDALTNGAFAFAVPDFTTLYSSK